MIFISEAQPISARLGLQMPSLRASMDEARRGSAGAVPEVSSIGLGHSSKREGGGMKIELYFPESDQIYRIEYETSIESLNVQFHNADWYHYKAVPPELVNDWTKASSAGSFFHARIKPVYVGEKWHTGTLAERAEIWLRSKDSEQYAGCWVALAMGSPVTVIGYAETEEQARAAAGEGGGEFVVVEVPNV